MEPRVIRASLLVYGTLHFLVDATGAAAVLAILARDTAVPASRLLFVYGLISFASRPVLGFLVDRRRSARHAALFGSVLVAIGWAVAPAGPLTAVTVLGIGNALFHVGAGSICFRLAPGRAGPSGFLRLRERWASLWGPLLVFEPWISLGLAWP